MTKENSLYTFENGKGLDATNLNKNFEILRKRIDLLEEEIAKLKGKKIID